MSPKMVRMLKWLATHDAYPNLLKKANQLTLRGLVLRGHATSFGITGSGRQALHDYQHAEWIGRKAENKDFAPSVLVALGMVRGRKKA